MFFEFLDQVDVLPVRFDGMYFTELDELVAFEGVQRGRVEEDLCCSRHSSHDHLELN